jgi:fatty-acid desaturase
MGELFQNNHHHAKDSANFAQKWFEIDMTYIIMRVLHTVRIIKLKPAAVHSSSVAIQSEAASVRGHNSAIRSSSKTSYQSQL